MHELSLMSEIVSLADKLLAPYRVRRVNELTVRAGILANVLPDAFAFAFEALAAGTIYQDARLNVAKLPLSALCRACGQTYESMIVPPACPRCGSHDAEITGGTEVLLTGIDFDEEENDEDRN